MSAIKFELWKSVSDRLWYWHVRSEGNGKVIARSTDGYFNRADCLHSIQLVQGYASAARVYDLESGMLVHP